MQLAIQPVLGAALWGTLALAARQPYDVRKIIEAFRQPHNDLTILCAHRGLRWNGTAENSRDAYFRAAEAGIECIETDIHLSRDGHLPMMHDKGVGRTTDAGEQAGAAAYNPFTGRGHNPKAAGLDYAGSIERLHLRDEAGRTHRETVPTLPAMVESLRDAGANVVLQLDFKDRDAVAPAHWALRNLTNAAGVPANEWCVYKLQAAWWKTPAELEALDWVQDAFARGVRLAYIPVYQPADEGQWDMLGSLKAFARANYSISAEFETKSAIGPLAQLQDYMLHNGTDDDTFRTSGIFYAPGDFVDPITTSLTRFDTANFSLPDDIRFNGSAWQFQEDQAPQLLDSLAQGVSADGRDHRSDFAWILQRGFRWVIADTADLWHDRLKRQGKRNLEHLLADGQAEVGAGMGWYRKRAHARDFVSGVQRAAVASSYSAAALGPTILMTAVNARAACF